MGCVSLYCVDLPLDYKGGMAGPEIPWIIDSVGGWMCLAMCEFTELHGYSITVMWLDSNSADLRLAYF